METEAIGATRRADPLDAWAALLKEPTANGAADTLGDTVMQMLRAFDGSDVRLPDPASSAPGDTGSAAPQGVDLNGEVSRLSLDALAAQRMAAGSLHAAPSGWQLAPVSDCLMDHPLNTVSATAAATVTAPTQSASAPSPLAASLWGGDVHEAQAGSTLATHHFNVTSPRR
jgi:hypothetical protein